MGLNFAFLVKAAMPYVQTIVLPKVHDCRDLELLDQALHGKIGNYEIIASIESARALWNIGDIAKWRSPTGLAAVTGLLVSSHHEYPDVGRILQILGAVCC